MTVFYIDDDADEIELFCEAVKKVNPSIHYITTTDAYQGLLLLSKMQPHLIFLDLHMPKKSGVECLREIRQMKQLDLVPVILYSSDADSKDIQQLTRLGATQFLNKRGNFVELCQDLHDIFLSVARINHT
jgi:CheY-like chemotaxis protein